MGTPDATLGFGEAWEVRRVDETGSTNADLLVAARGGAPAGIVLVADHQTAGRGRLERAWVAPAGSSLLVSILARPTGPSALYHQLTQAVALAARHAALEVAGVRAELKWPNDLLVSGRKLAGILAESPGPGAVVVGLGLNVNWPAEHLPEGATALSVEAGRDIDRDEVLAALLVELRSCTPEGIHEAYRAALATIGQRVRVELPAGTYEGTAVDVEPDGRLVVETDDGERRGVAAGDVVHLRRA